MSIKSKEEKEARLQELTEEIEKNLDTYNLAIKQEKYEMSIEIDENIQKDLKEYKEIAQNLAFIECRDSGKPMLYAIEKLNYTYLSFKNLPTEEVAEIPQREIAFKTAKIDLIKLQKFCGENIGVEKYWDAKVQKLNCLLCMAVGKELEKSTKEIKKINDSFSMSKIARDLDMGKTPTSQTQLIKALDEVFKAMLGDEVARARKKDVGYLKNAYCKKSNKKDLELVCPKQSAFRNLIMELLHSIETGEDYTMSYPIPKEK